MTHPKLGTELAWDFMAYANVAEETYHGVHISDLDAEWVECAWRASQGLSLTWPPDLGTAEEFVLQHGPQIKFYIDSTPGGVRKQTQEEGTS